LLPGNDLRRKAVSLNRCVDKPADYRRGHSLAAAAEGKSVGIGGSPAQLPALPRLDASLAQATKLGNIPHYSPQTPLSGGGVKGPCLVLQNGSRRSRESPKTLGFSHEEQNQITLAAPSFRPTKLRAWTPAVDVSPATPVRHGLIGFEAKGDRLRRGPPLRVLLAWRVKLCRTRAAFCGSGQIKSEHHATNHPTDPPSNSPATDSLNLPLCGRSAPLVQIPQTPARVGRQRPRGEASSGGSLPTSRGHGAATSEGSGSCSP